MERLRSSFHADATSSVRTENVAPTSGFYFELREIIKRTKTSRKRGRRYPTSSVIKILRAHPSIVKSRWVVLQSSFSSIRDVIVLEQEGMKFSCITVSTTRVSRASLTCYTRARERDRTLNWDVK